MKKLHFSGLLALIALLLLSTCSNPAGDKNVEEGTFTINLGAFSRSALDYPPQDVPGGSSGGPFLAELKFEVIFTEVVSSTEKTFTFMDGQTASGKIAVGTYAVTMNVLYEADNSPYAKGVALLNPVEIKSGTNTNITIQVYDPEDALPPLISVQPVGASYDLADTFLPLTVSAASIEGGVLSYQWYSSPTDTNNPSTPGVVSVGTSPALTPPINFLGDEYYFVVITNTYSGGGGNPINTVASNTAKIQVVTAPAIIDNTVTLVGFYNLTDAMTHLNTDPAYILAGTYTVKIREDQNLAPTTFNNTNTRDVTLIAEPPASSVTVKLSSNGCLFQVPSNLTLTLDAGITLRGRNAADNGTDNTNYMIRVNGGELIMKAGSTITRNSTSVTGSAVYVESAGIFTMEGGEISWNTGNNGPGVNVDSGGTFTMEDGIITRNSANGLIGTGGGVRITDSSFTMRGGEISWNTATGSGGGVYVFSNGPLTSFTMEGGEISWNTTINYGGGGVYVSTSANFSMESGVIKGNTSHGFGGGVSISGTFTKAPAVPGGTSGTITGWGDDPVNGNTVKNASEIPVTSGSGHAVYVDFTHRREKTVGPTENMSWDESTSTATGSWTDPL